MGTTAALLALAASLAASWPAPQQEDPNEWWLRLVAEHYDTVMMYREANIDAALRRLNATPTVDQHMVVEKTIQALQAKKREPAALAGGVAGLSKRAPGPTTPSIKPQSSIPPAAKRWIVELLPAAGALQMEAALMATRRRDDAGGLDPASWLDAPAVVESARSTDVLVYGVSASSSFTARSANESAIMLRQRPAMLRWFDEDPTLFPHMLVEKVADATGGEMMYVNGTRDLAVTFGSIVQGFWQRYLIAYTPAGVPAKGWHPSKCV